MEIKQIYYYSKHHINTMDIIKFSNKKFYIEPSLIDTFYFAKGSPSEFFISSGSWKKTTAKVWDFMLEKSGKEKQIEFCQALPKRNLK